VASSGIWNVFLGSGCLVSSGWQATTWDGTVSNGQCGCSSRVVLDHPRVVKRDGIAHGVGLLLGYSGDAFEGESFGLAVQDLIHEGHVRLLPPEFPHELEEPRLHPSRAYLV
jgi:hypothetical protein